MGKHMCACNTLISSTCASPAIGCHLHKKTEHGAAPPFPAPFEPSRKATPSSPVQMKRKTRSYLFTDRYEEKQDPNDLAGWCCPWSLQQPWVLSMVRNLTNIIHDLPRISKTVPIMEQDSGPTPLSHSRHEAKGIKLNLLLLKRPF